MKAYFGPLVGLCFAALMVLSGCRLPLLNSINVTAGLAQPINIMQLSDLHVRGDDQLYANAMAMVNETEPDLLVFTGDLVESSEGLPFLVKYLDQITVDCPKFAILGNWEYWGGLDLISYQEILAEHGVSLLVNELATLNIGGRELTLVGMDDYLGGRPLFDTQAFSAQTANIVLAHCPILFDTVLAQSRDTGLPFLMLSGHTHGGQITFFGQPVVLPDGSGEYVAGRYDKEHGVLVVSKGIGTSSVPIRLFADPGIELISY